MLHSLVYPGYMYQHFKSYFSMKYLFFLFFPALFFSCSKEDANSEKIPVIGGRFVHEFENCDNSENPEINCAEYIYFIDESTADILLGGDDMIFRVDYYRSNNRISIEQTAGINRSVSFQIDNKETLIRLEDGTTWKRE